MSKRFLPQRETTSRWFAKQESSPGQTCQNENNWWIDQVLSNVVFVDLLNGNYNCVLQNNMFSVKTFLQDAWTLNNYAQIILTSFQSIARVRNSTPIKSAKNYQTSI